MNSELIDGPEEKITIDSPLFSALSWWEKKRIWFNVFVGASGLTAIALYASSFSTGDLIGLVLYGLLLNVCYSLGFLLEAFNQYYLKQKIDIEKLRLPFLIVGTLFSTVITFVWTIIYYTW